MKPILSLTTFLGNPGDVKEGDAFDTERSFEAYVRRQREEAAFEERLARAVEQGLEDVEAGRVSDDLEGLFARVEAKFQEGTHDE